MKKLILSELLLLFLATTFVTDTPPAGWYQQTLPVSDQINDIFFLDSLTGWVVTNSNLNPPDSGYIMKTTDGGNNWVIQNTGLTRFNVVQFLNANTGYAGAEVPTAEVYKTINGGNNWSVVSSMLTGLADLVFVNSDTGWYCDPSGFGGLFKTTNGGTNWQLQLNDTYLIKKLFFISKDTGWAGSNDYKLYRTTNGGANWNLQYTFSAGLAQIFFITKDTGFVSGGFGTHSVKKTTDGGFHWDSTTNSLGGKGLYFINNQTGWNCDVFSIVQKTTDGGLNWYRQTVPSGYYYSIQFADTSNGWAGGTILIHTIDGGGPPVGIIKSNITVNVFRLKQNYPNPFNGVTLIFFDLPVESRVDLMIYNILGEEVSELLDNEYFTAGSVQFGFDSNKEELSSGVYFYRLIVRTTDKKETFIDTKKMVLVK